MSEWRAQVVAARQGDLPAFTAVVHRFEDMAVGYAYALLGDREARRTRRRRPSSRPTCA